MTISIKMHFRKNYMGFSLWLALFLSNDIFLAIKLASFKIILNCGYLLEGFSFEYFLDLCFGSILKVLESFLLILLEFHKIQAYQKICVKFLNFDPEEERECFETSLFW